MSSVHEEIVALEERLRQAELGPDPAFFDQALADDMIVVGDDGQPAKAKSKIVAAHQPGREQKFTRVEMRDMQILDHGRAAVVTCTGVFEGANGRTTLKFMRVWVKKDERWQIVAATVSN
jgi:uncharacterized protein (TIGR02246 family)